MEKPDLPNQKPVDPKKEIEYPNAPKEIPKKDFPETKPGDLPLRQNQPEPNKKPGLDGDVFGR